VVDQNAQVAIVGAGPYGLAATAFLRHAGIETRVFGQPMSFWEQHMPKGMLLRSRWRSSHIADPTRSLGLDAFERDRGVELPDHLVLENFIDYGRWYRDHAAPDVDRRQVESIERSNGGFRLRLSDGGEAAADRVVVAAGLRPFPRRPPPLGKLPTELVSHTSDHDDYSGFGGRRVLVVGAGQSALEAAALLAEAEADVEVVLRAPSVVWLAPEGPAHGVRDRYRKAIAPPTDVGGKAGWIAAAPDLFRLQPRRARDFVFSRCTVPAGGSWLRPPLEGVPQTVGRRIISAEREGDGVKLKLDDGTERSADHVVLGTGFQVDVGSYPFLSQSVLRGLDVSNGYPTLGRGLESSVPGLHFVGAPAALSFGPIMRFVVGTWYAAPAMAERIAGRPRRPIRFSYRPRLATWIKGVGSRLRRRTR
jgi:hypothetical protein